MSHEPIPLDPELTALETALGALKPSRSRLDRDLVMYQAGQASMRHAERRRWAWMATAASFGLVALVEGWLLVQRPEPRIVERLVVVREPAEVRTEPTKAASLPGPETEISALRPESRTRFSDSANGRLIEQIYRYGLDGLPAAPATAWTDSESRLAPSRQLLQQELRRLLDPGDRS